ncbi:MAG: hypothetical protein HDS79_00695 [Bacteroidales bacterium]|nr:hypothetical protein [Bacteroidales bacterium]
MATKNDYYQKILASHQAEITSLKTALVDLGKELESLKESITETSEPAPTPQLKHVYNESDEIQKFMQRVSDVCDYKIQQRDALLSDRFAGKQDFEKFSKSLDEKFISSETFTKYQKELDSRLNAVEEKAGQGISLMSINRYYGDKPKGYKSIFDNYMVLNLKRTQFQGCLPVLVWFIIAALAALLWSLSK